MIHSSLHWVESGVDDLYFWYFSVKHSVWLYNRVPNKSSGITPMEMLTKKNSNHRELRCSHVWGCPMYVLEAKLQNNQKLSKWNQRSRLGQISWFFWRALHISCKCSSPTKWLHIAAILPCFQWFFRDSSSLRGQWTCHWQYLQWTFRSMQIMLLWRRIWICRSINISPTTFF